MHGLKNGASLIAEGIVRASKEKMKSVELWKRRGAKDVEAAGEKKPAKAVKKE